MKIIKIISIITILFFASLVFLNISKAVYFATDTIYLYENGKRIHDNRVFTPGFGSCRNGRCTIGQQSYPIIIYRIRNNNITTFLEFKSKDRWIGVHRSKVYKNYLEYLEKNNGYYYYISFNPGPSEGGMGVPPGEIGGRIGDYRAFVLEIDTGNYKKISGEPAEIFKKNIDIKDIRDIRKPFWKNILPINNIIYSSIFIIVLVLIIYFIKNRKKYKYKNQK